MKLTDLSFAYPDVAARERAPLYEVETTVANDGGGVFVFPTCLRIEVAWTDSPDEAAQTLRELFGGRALPPARVRTDFEAFHHLSRVAAGLESPQLGETEVLSQFRQALQRRAGAGESQSEIFRTMESVVGVARSARRSLTHTQDGSLADAAVRMVETHPDVVVLGAGAMAGAVVRRLDKSRVSVYSRRPASVAGIPSRPWKGVPRALTRCTAVVSTIPGSVADLERLDRSGDPLLLVDLGMPPALTSNPPSGVVYRDVDDVAASVRSHPEPEAEKRVALESQRAWQRLNVSHEAGVMISSVVDRVERTVDEEVHRFAGRLPASSDAEPILRQLAHTVARRIIHPSVSLLGSTPLAPEELDVLARAFGVQRG